MGRLRIKICEDLWRYRRLFYMYPDSRVVLVVRDGRDVSESVGRPNSGSDPAREFPAVTELVGAGRNPVSVGAEVWVRYMERFCEVMEVCGDRALVVRYDRLVEDFEGECRRLVWFLGGDRDDLWVLTSRADLRPRRGPNWEVWRDWTDGDRSAWRSVPGAEAMLARFGYSW